MSFRTSAIKVVSASSDQSRGINVTRKAQDDNIGGTDPLRCSVFLRNAVFGDHTNVDTIADLTHARPSPLAFNQPGSIADGHIALNNSQNAATRTFLQTRRRQPSTSSSNTPLGPRPLDQQNSKRYWRSEIWSQDPMLTIAILG